VADEAIDEDGSPNSHKPDHSDTDFAEEPADSEADDDDDVGHVDPRELQVSERTAKGGIANNPPTKQGKARKVLSVPVPSVPVPSSVKKSKKAPKKFPSVPVPSSVKKSKKAPKKINSKSPQSENSVESKSRSPYKTFPAPTLLMPFVQQQLGKAVHKTIQSVPESTSQDPSTSNPTGQSDQVKESIKTPKPTKENASLAA